MAQSNVPVTSGSGNNIDTWTTATNSQKRQAVVIGDPSVDAGVASVDATKGLKVDITPTNVSPATQNITVQDTGSTTTTLANSQSVRTGSPTAGSVATFNLSGVETVIIQATGTWTGTLLIEGAFDGGTRYYQKAVKQIGTSYIANNFIGNFSGTMNSAGLTQVAVRATAAWTGTATITIQTSLSDNGVYVHNGLSIQDATIATNKLTVKSASTAAIAADPAVVVSLSPNSPLFLLGRTTLPTAVASAASVQQLADRYGRAFAIDPILSLASSAGTAITINTNTSIVAAPGASTHLRMYRLQAQNSSATATWCYWGNGSGVKSVPFYLAQNQVYSVNLHGEWELSSNTALFLNTATTGANIEWFVTYESLAD